MTGSMQLVAAASRLVLAAAIVYLALQLAELARTGNRVVAEIPTVTAETRRASEEAARVRALVPPILEEIATVRALVPDVLNEVAAVRRSLPGVLARVDAVEGHIEPVLEEVRLTRQAVDPALDRVQYLLDDAHAKAGDTLASAAKVGRGASEGVLTGLVTGMVKLPFSVVGTLVSPIVGEMRVDVASRLTEQDLLLIADAGDRLRDSAVPGRAERWRNPESGHAGAITPVRRHQLHGHECIEVHVTINAGNEELVDRRGDYCRTDQGLWVLATEITQP